MKKSMRKVIAVLLAVMMVCSVMVLSAGADPANPDNIQVSVLGERTIQLIGIPAGLQNPIANVYWVERVNGKRVYTFVAEDARVVDGVVQGNTPEVLEEGREYTVYLRDTATSYEAVLEFTYVIEAPRFDDVKYPCWYSDALNYCVKKGYLAGMGDNKFYPNHSVTRAQVATVLYAMAGKPATETVNNFTDVPSGKWYSYPVNWAFEHKIMAGYPEGDFQPDAFISRQQLAATLYKFAKAMNYDSAQSGSIASFQDANLVADWAVPGFEWALGHGVLSGDDKNRLLPTSPTSRAQLACVLTSLDKNVAAKGEADDTAPSGSSASADPKA